MRGRIAVLGALAAVPAVVAAAVPGELAVQPGSRVWVAGESNTSSFRCESAAPSGGAAAGLDLPRAGTVGRAEIVVPVSTLACGVQTMDEHLRDALRAGTSPDIRFAARRVRLAPARDGWTATLEGPLSIAGQTRPVRVVAAVTRENGQLRARGATPLRITRWGIAPPTLMKREVVVRPAVTVGFDVLLKP
ncbi:MAG TPA: YceI family protein [Longimicrobium sp.]|nr:YceI family protein [Longimicrobium sp.]